MDGRDERTGRIDAFHRIDIPGIEIERKVKEYVRTCATRVSARREVIRERIVGRCVLAHIPRRFKVSRVRPHEANEPGTTRALRAALYTRALPREHGRFRARIPYSI